MSKRIQRVFEQQGDRKVMNLFLTAGYPSPDTTVQTVMRCIEAGADIIELGMPFSDPLADGPTIQRSSTSAIAQGISLQKVFAMVEAIRAQTETPIILMGYMNTLFHYGVERFCEHAAQAGVDGLILPDLPVEEQDWISSFAKKFGLCHIHLVAPNTSDERMRWIDAQAEGFIYCVSVTGVTGARDGQQLQASVDQFMDRVVQNIRKTPVLIGFGIRNKEDALRIAAKVNGFIVGSALIEHIEAHYPNPNWQEELSHFVQKLR
jgi:tryptophan synthase alpha chain